MGWHVPGSQASRLSDRLRQERTGPFEQAVRRRLPQWVILPRTSQSRMHAQQRVGRRINSIATVQPQSCRRRESAPVTPSTRANRCCPPRVLPITRYQRSRQFVIEITYMSNREFRRDEPRWPMTGARAPSADPVPGRWPRRTQQPAHSTGTRVLFAGFHPDSVRPTLTRSAVQLSGEHPTTGRLIRPNVDGTGMM